MNSAELHATARALVAPGKGILAADESSGTIKKRLSWHAIFMGSDVERPSLSPAHTVRIKH